ncbi:MAG TPA: hypothetical protein VJH03_25290 [Blastocatellia bacterium]|nr:hypothetical protein [Blastocatellia bacterium]
MLDILQNLSRAVLALLSGAMLIFGFFFFADGASSSAPSGYGQVWTETQTMLSERYSLYVFVPIAAVTAYVLGIINVAVSSLLFSLVCEDAKDDLVVISQLEGLQKPQLLKETLDFLHINRALVAFFLPLIMFGFGLACDRYEWKHSPGVRIAAGTLLGLAGVLAPILAWWLTRLLQTITRRLSDEAPHNKR